MVICKQGYQPKRIPDFGFAQDMLICTATRLQERSKAMLNIFADALLIATRMDGLSRRTGDNRPRPEADHVQHRSDPPSRIFTLVGVRL
jgi:hypothetical protein